MFVLPRIFCLLACDPWPVALGLLTTAARAHTDTRHGKHGIHVDDCFLPVRGRTHGQERAGRATLTLSEPRRLRDLA